MKIIYMELKYRFKTLCSFIQTEVRVELALFIICALALDLLINNFL